MTATQPEAERLKHVYRGLQAQWVEHNPGNRAIIRERSVVLEEFLRTAGLLPLSDRRILDVGCGSGHVLAGFARWGIQPANLYGVDLLEDRIAIAQQRFPESHFSHANAEHLDFEAGAFDLVLLFTVFSSILDGRMALNVAAEVSRVLKAGGAVIWYDFRYNNPRNPHVHGMTTAAIHALFPCFDLDLRTTTLLPPLARRLGRATPLLYPLLTRMPLLRTHLLGLLTKR